MAGDNDQLPCPQNIEDLAEAYVTRRLSPRERAKLEEHCLGCQICAERVRTMSEFIAAIRRAAGLKDPPKSE